MLEYDPSRRINLAEALQHPFMQNLPPEKKLSSKPREVSVYLLLIFYVCSMSVSSEHKFKTHNCRIQQAYDQPAADRTRYAKEKCVYTVQDLNAIFVLLILLKKVFNFLNCFEWYFTLLKGLIVSKSQYRSFQQRLVFSKPLNSSKK